jgi:hypothetical protein
LPAGQICLPGKFISGHLDWVISGLPASCMAREANGGTLKGSRKPARMTVPPGGRGG